MKIFLDLFDFTLSFKFYSNIVLYALGLVSSSLFTTTDTGDNPPNTSHQLYLTSLSENTLPTHVYPIIFIYVMYFYLNLCLNCETANFSIIPILSYVIM